MPMIDHHHNNSLCATTESGICKINHGFKLNLQAFQAMAAQKSSPVYIFRGCVVTLAITSLLMSALSCAMARPREGSPNQYCVLNEMQQEICQKCAKITKSKYVYPMCCNEEDGVYLWCTEYVNFGV